jgi:riboflavin kinase / FMN adenylyltransferase
MTDPMDRYRSFDEVPAAPQGRALAVGTFDGVHLGHRRVIQGTLDWGRSHDALACVVTFDPHPLEVLLPQETLRLLTPPEVKADLIESLGVDELLMIPFTREFSELEAEDFCEQVLAGALGARHVSVGENFRFGYGARGDAGMLQARREFETAIVPLVEHQGRPVSSSRIRTLLESGEVRMAAELLGAPFALEGQVVSGDARGRSLGVPTANVKPREDVLVPAAGIYAGRMLDRPAAISIGIRPTFEQDGELLIEAHLIDFDGDLYDQTVRMVFLERLRDEQRFDSTDDLVKQMRRDIEQVRDLVG